MGSSAETLVGQRIGKFLIEQKLGEGGMGAVYRAVDTTLERTVALKVIKPELARESGFAGRFRREAKVAARLRHPGALEIYEYDDGSGTGGLLTMAFEFVRGRELYAWIRESAGLSPGATVHILGQVLDALAAAHLAGIVHRDLKPQNVMIEDGPELRAKILDFGIAKLRAGDGAESVLTLAGQVMGTVAYMSPEQATGSEVDARTDIYAVGVMLYQCLSGALPFQGKTALEMLEQHRSAPIPALDRPELAAFDPVIRRAMAKAPAERYPDAEAFAAALREALSASGQPPFGAVRRGSGRLAAVEPSTPEAWAVTQANAPPREEPAAAPPSSRLEHSGVSAAGVLPTPPATSPPPPADGEAATAETGPVHVDTERFFGALTGRTIGKYVVEELLGAGGMGAVFRASDELLGRPVAIKVVHPALAHRADVRRRFLREARAALEFVHPNAVATRACEETQDGLLYMVQDYSPGRSLRAILKETPRPGLERSLGIARQVLLALSEAHRKGIVHRDLKPENMLVERDELGVDLVRVCDFGLAKMLDSSGTSEGGDSLTTAGQALGTPHYMPPEQVESGQLDGRADVYSLGCVLYELLTGTRPFDADTIRSLVFMHMAKPPQPPRERTPEAQIPPAVERLVLRMLNKDPADRPDAEAVLAELDALGLDLPGVRASTLGHRRGSGRLATLPDALGEALAETRPPAPPVRTGGWAPRAAAAAAAVLLVGGVAASWRPSEPEPERAVAITPTASDAPGPSVGPPAGDETRPEPDPAALAEAARREAEAQEAARAAEAQRQAEAEAAEGARREREQAERQALEEERARLARERAETEERLRAAEAEAARLAEARRIAEERLARERAEREEEERRRQAAIERRRREREAAEQREREERAREEAERRRREQELEAKQARLEALIAEVKALERQAGREAEAASKGEQVARLERELARDRGQDWPSAAGGPSGDGGLAEPPPGIPRERQLPDGRVAYAIHGLELVLRPVSARQVVVGGETARVDDLYAAGPLTVRQYAAYVEAAPGPDKAAAFQPLRPFVKADRPGTLLDKLDPAARDQPIRGVPLEVARKVAAWFELRLPADGEAMAAAEVLGHERFAWTRAGHGAASERGRAVYMEQYVERARPVIVLVR